MSGISKTMLGQIERGESNPSIATVWKIANGLKISFTALIHEPKSDTTIHLRENTKVPLEDGDAFVFIHIFLLKRGVTSRCT